MTFFLILLFTLHGDSLGSDLITFVSDPPSPPEKIAACQTENILSCSVVQINFPALDDITLNLPGDSTVTFVDKPGEDSFYFKDDKGTEATFTRGITKEGNFKLLGNVLYSDGRDFTLEPCLAFKDCHVWMEEDESHWVDEGSVAVTKEEMLDAVLNRRTPDPEKMALGRSDSTTVVTYTVMFYYTPEFAAVTEDIPLFVSQVIAETNQGYINSGIPVRVSSHCIAAATLHDNGDAVAMINQFSNYKPIEELRNSADAAALLVKSFNSCGIGKLDSFLSGYTITVTQKSCALGYFSFGHELGHNFGCMHDALQGPNNYYSYGLGKHISLDDNNGVRTIMAYSAEGFRTRVNWWSNPDTTYQGVATGTEEEDNARVIREHRFAFADIGDESNVCESTTSTTPTTTITTTTTTTPTTTPTINTTQPTPTLAPLGILVSPNFPSNYSNHLESTMTILVEEGRRVNIEFTHLDIESHSSCDYDFITVIDDDGTVLLNKTCGSTLPPQFESQTNRVNVHFKTDYSVTKTGWRLTYSLIPATGEVTSENYPENYNNDMDKTYPVEVATGKGIRITFNDFDIESHSSCDYDYVMIKEANGNELLNKSCGDTKPGDLTSIQNKVDIIFHSDYSVTKKGFKLTWTEV